MVAYKTNTTIYPANQSIAQLTLMLIIWTMVIHSEKRAIAPTSSIA